MLDLNAILVTGNLSNCNMLGGRVGGQTDKAHMMGNSSTIGLSVIERPILISRLNLNLIQISWKAPPPLFCLLLRYSAHIMSCDITLPNHISCIIEHLIKDLAEKFPPPETSFNIGQIAWQKILKTYFPCTSEHISCTIEIHCSN